MEPKKRKNGKPKSSTRMKTKKTNMLMTLKNTFSNKTGKHKSKTQSHMKAWKWYCLQEHENRELFDIPEDE